jgi:hypothetical protein
MGRLGLAALAMAFSFSTSIGELELDDPYKYGYDTVDLIIKGDVTPDDDSVNKTCATCKGTGKVGDGRVSVTCLECGGDGKEGDLVSNLPGGSSSGFSYSSPRRGRLRKILRLKR